ncbi:uncharacterized protein LOC132702351 [Cylas formicarius]|uniref:uncharacterized protein LOC132702351 n=1 Tax=Cylas formicarius TaxID=197179 RepID=UPI00295854E0|nr:uncharacterized protein LOC132702351 [Cylas formicarius]
MVSAIAVFVFAVSFARSASGDENDVLMAEMLLGESCFPNGDDTFCWEAPTEPKTIAKIEKRLREYDCDGHTFGKMMNRTSYVDVTLEQKFGLDCELCNANVNVRVRPTTVGAKKLMHVIDTEKYDTILWLSTCANDQTGSRCSKGFSDLIDGYTTECQQQFSEVTLLVFDAIEDQLVTRNLKYPSGCNCVYMPAKL